MEVYEVFWDKFPNNETFDACKGHFRFSQGFMLFKANSLIYFPPVIPHLLPPISRPQGQQNSQARADGSAAAIGRLVGIASMPVGRRRWRALRAKKLCVVRRRGDNII